MFRLLYLIDLKEFLENIVCKKNALLNPSQDKSRQVLFIFSESVWKR